MLGRAVLLSGSAGIPGREEEQASCNVVRSPSKDEHAMTKMASGQLRVTNYRVKILGLRTRDLTRD